MNAATSTRAERNSRARTSLRWSVRAIRPSGPTAYFGLPRKRSKTQPALDKAGYLPAGCRSGRVVAVLGRASLGGPSLRLDVQGGWVRLDLALLRGTLGLHVLVVVVLEALGLGLEDPQGTAAPAGQLRQLGRAEEQDQDGQDE